MATEFYYNKCKYTCCIVNKVSSQELRIRNERGEVLAVEKGKKLGLQGKTRENSKQVDVSQSYLYNLIKAAINALEIADKDRMLLEQEIVIERQNQQIELLKQELDIFQKNKTLSLEQEKKLIQLQNNLKEHEVLLDRQKQRILKLEDEQSQLPQTISLEKAEKKVRSKLGESAWLCLHPSSQRDLCNAYRFYQMIKSDNFTDRVINYSTAGHPLGLVAEREIVAPFFKNLYQFLFQRNNSVQFSGRDDFKPSSKYTWGDLPPLISTQWDAFKDNVLEQEEILPTTHLEYTVFHNSKIILTDRHLVKEFLQQWQHPLSQWLSQAEAAASSIDKIRQLRNRASHAENIHKNMHVETILYHWQFKLLWFYLIGSKTRKGTLQEIYSNLDLVESTSDKLKEKTVTYNYFSAYSSIGCI